MFYLQFNMLIHYLCLFSGSYGLEYMDLHVPALHLSVEIIKKAYTYICGASMNKFKNLFFFKLFTNICLSTVFMFFKSWLLSFFHLFLYPLSKNFNNRDLNQGAVTLAGWSSCT